MRSRKPMRFTSALLLEKICGFMAAPIDDRCNMSGRIYVTTILKTQFLGKTLHHEKKGIPPIENVELRALIDLIRVGYFS